MEKPTHKSNRNNILKEKGNLSITISTSKEGPIKSNQFLTAHNEHHFISTSSSGNHIDIYEDFQATCETEVTLYYQLTKKDLILFIQQKSEDPADYTQRKETALSNKRMSAKKRLYSAKKHLSGPAELYFDGYGASFSER